MDTTRRLRMVVLRDKLNARLLSADFRTRFPNSARRYQSILESIKWYLWKDTILGSNWLVTR